MGQPAFILQVVHSGGNPLLKEGDRWRFCGDEVQALGSAKICARSICGLYPQMQTLLRIGAANPKLAPIKLSPHFGSEAIFEARLENIQVSRPAQASASAQAAPPAQPPSTASSSSVSSSGFDPAKTVTASQLLSAQPEPAKAPGTAPAQMRFPPGAPRPPTMPPQVIVRSQTNGDQRKTVLVPVGEMLPCEAKPPGNGSPEVASAPSPTGMVKMPEPKRISDEALKIKSQIDELENVDLDDSENALSSTGVGGLTRRMERVAVSAQNTRVPFMDRVPPHVAVQMVSMCTKKEFDRGEVILEKGVVGQHLYVVGDGKVEVTQVSSDGSSETVLAVLGVGECFGEMSLLTGQATSATVRARVASVIFMLSRDQLNKILQYSPELHGIFSTLLADRIRAVNTNLESELSRGIHGRLSLIPMTDLIQTLTSSKRTGTLMLNYKGKTASVGFKDGKMVGCKCGKLMGDEGLYDLFMWEDADFVFEAEEFPEKDYNIKRDAMHLMMEGLRRMDEARKS
jgi:CRP-like cAMP-binding protein